MDFRKHPVESATCKTPNSNPDDVISAPSSGLSSDKSPSASPSASGDRKALTPQRMERFESLGNSGGGGSATKVATPQRKPVTSGTGVTERNKVLEAQLGAMKTEIQTWKNKYEAEQVKNERLQGKVYMMEESTVALDTHLTRTKQSDEMKGRTAEIEVLRSRLIEKEKAISNLKANQKTLDQDSLRRNNKVQDYKLNLQQKTAQLEDARKRECETAEKSAAMEQQVKDLTRQLNRAQNRQGQTEQKLVDYEQLKKDHAALVAEVSQKKDEDAFRKLRIEGKTEQLAAYQTQIEAANTMKSRIEGLEKHNEALRSRMKSYNETVQNLKTTQDALREAQTRIDTLETSSKRLAQQVTGKNEKLEELTGSFSEAKRIITDLTREKTELEMKNETLQGKKETYEGLRSDINDGLEATKEALQRAVEGGRTEMLPQLYSQVEQLTQELAHSKQEIHFLKNQTSTTAGGETMDLPTAIALAQKYREGKEKYKLLVIDLQQKYEEKKMYYKTKVEAWEEENNAKREDLQQALKQKEDEMREALEKESLMKEALEKKEQEVVAAREEVASQKEVQSVSSGKTFEPNTEDKTGGDKRVVESIEESPSKMPKATAIDKGKGKGKGKGPPPPAPKKRIAPKSPTPFDGVKLRPLFWAPAQSYAGSIWSTLSAKCSAEEESTLEQLFMPKPESSSSSFFKPSERKADTNLKFITVLDTNKQQSLAIQFRSLPSVSELMRHLRDGDHNSLNPEQVVALVREGFVSDEMIAEIRAQQKLHPLTPLGLPEQYFLALSEMPEAKDLLRVWLFITNFSVETTPLFAKLEAIRRGASTLRRCEEIPPLLSKLLAAGNRLNAGSVRADYTGFSIDSLIKFAESKATDGSGRSLCEVVVQPLWSDTFTNSFRSVFGVIESSCMCLKDLECQVNVVEKEAQVVRGLCYGASPSALSWQNCMADSYRVLERTDELTKTLADTKNAMDEVRQYFGVALDKSSDEFFRIWQQFLSTLLAFQDNGRR